MSNDDETQTPGSAGDTSSAHERQRRPLPERTRPIRDPSTLFRSSDDSARAAAGISDVVSQSVKLGYSVVREQIERGRRTAQQFGGRSSSGDGPAAELNDIGRRVLDLSSEFGTMYVDLINAMARMPAAASQARTAPAGPASGKARPSGTRVVVDIDASRPSRVAIDLEPGAGTSELRVPALLGSDDTAAPLTEVAFETGPDGQPLVLRITVPDAQASGVYTGAIVDSSTNAPQGTLSVTLL